jgi:hypothetical protein
MKTPATVAYEALVEVRRVGASFTESELTVRTHPDVAHVLRIAIQAAAPFIDRALLSRLSVVEDPASRPDQFDVNAG